MGEPYSTGIESTKLEAKQMEVMEKSVSCQGSTALPTRKQERSSVKKAGGRYPKARGSNFERELVNQAKEFGLSAERAYASNGKALGCTEGVDLKVEDVRIQAKRRKKLADYLQIPDGADAVVFREDCGESLTLIRYDYFLELIETSSRNNLRAEGSA